MPIFKLKLIEQKPVATNTFEFRFEKPDNFNFVAGQYGGFTLINPAETDAGGITRRFSLLSAPQDNHIGVTTRVQQSAYKRMLCALKPGEEIKFAGPSGNFTLHEDAHIPAVMIAGGIGIAPFYSIIRDCAAREPQRNITLFYGNQTVKDSAYLAELTALARQMPNFKFVAVLNAPDADWQGETGFITHTMLRKYIVDLATPIYYICGSPVMVTTLQETLLEMGIDQERIKVEDFPGY
jgi:ferredoxin-NADP reductase